MQYDKEILQVLIEAGCEGISVQKISRHVHNACNSLFNPLSQSDIHKYVQQFLLRNCKTDTSLVEKTKKGIYRLNVNNGMTQQLFLQFREDREPVEETPEKDYSLDLFGNLDSDVQLGETIPPVYLLYLLFIFIYFGCVLLKL